MQNIYNLYSKRIAEKLVNCYCADCLGRSALGSAPRIFEENDGKLTNPDGCMCQACLKREHFNSNLKPIMEFADYADFKDLSCCCIDCMNYGVYAPPKLPECKIERLYKTFCPLDVIWLKNSYEGSVRIWSEGRWLFGTLIRYTYEYANKNIHVLRKSINFKYNGLHCFDRTLQEFNKIEKFQFSEREIFYDGKLVKSPSNEKLSDETIFKICYYGEYKGYTSIIYGLNISILVGIFSKKRLRKFCIDVRHGETIIEFRGKTNEEIIKSHSLLWRNRIFAILDQWCYECEKYKGACRGHEILEDPIEKKIME